MLKQITITNTERPGKRARLVWQPWWRGRTVALHLEELGEQGWTPRHRVTLRARNWVRGATIAQPWLGINTSTDWGDTAVEGPITSVERPNQ